MKPIYVLVTYSDCGFSVDAYDTLLGAYRARHEIMVMNWDRENNPETKPASFDLTEDGYLEAYDLWLEGELPTSTQFYVQVVRGVWDE